MRTAILVQHDVISIELAAVIIGAVAIAGVVVGGALHAAWVERHERREARIARTRYLEAKAEKQLIANEQRLIELWEDQENMLTDVAPVTMAPPEHESLGDRLRNEAEPDERETHAEGTERDAGAGVKTERAGAPGSGAGDAGGGSGWTPEADGEGRERD